MTGMALSNRDRIGKMFELLAPPLDVFIQSAVGSKLNGDADWTKLLELKDGDKGSGKQYRRLDPQDQLRMITENVPARLKKDWYPFSDALGRVGQSYCQELRDVRNAWAHNESFNEDDTQRHLDTAERLLVMVSAPEAADEVKQIRLSLRRIAAERDDKKTLQAAVISPGSAGLQPWRDVLAPHPDIAEGNFQAAEFAADLYKVSTGQADSGYQEPDLFLARTYLTDGLKDLIGRSVKRLAGDANSSPVINLQTNFGGGKTHSMLTLWHLASGTPAGKFPQELQELLADTPYAELSGVRRVALVGNHLATTGSTKPDGTSVNTIWGELAYQLGGIAGFQLVQEADAAGTPPGQALHTLLETYAPALILIDEWVAYARTLVGRDDLAAGTFDDQFTFAQSLTEAVKGTPGVLLAISIPASESGDDAKPARGSEEEVGGAHGLEALRRLQNVVRRVADQWRPASSVEAYRIVRQRLFQEPDATALAAINQTGRAFVELYHKHPDDFPREARDGAYEDRIKATYPIHPELFDRLYEDWSSLERFQRTRGVLRLMNTVIQALWQGGDQAPLIMPGSIPLSDGSVNSEIAQYLQDSWKAVIDADVDGENCEPKRIDDSRTLFGQRQITRRLARTVFFGAAPTVGSAHKGLERQRVFLGTATPGDVPGNFLAALDALGDRATYFYNAGGRYWYDLQANISRRAKDQAERVHIEEVYQEIVGRLSAQARQRGEFAGVHACPNDSGDIPDADDARLVILHPKYTHKRGVSDSHALVFARSATERRGTANRTYRNMLVYLASDQERATELESAVREYLGWKSVLEKADDLDLTGSQRNQASERATKASQTIDSRLLGAYHWVLVPTGQPVKLETSKIDSSQSAALAERVSRKLGNDGELAVHHAASLIRHQLDTHAKTLWDGGTVTAGGLWRLYSEYPYMPRLRDRSVLNAGLTGPQLLWEQEGFALADDYDPETGRYRGLVLPTDNVGVTITDATVVVPPDRAKAQRSADQAQAAAAALAASKAAGTAAAGTAFGGSADADAGPDPVGTEPGRPVGEAATPPLKTRYFGVTELSGDRYASDFRKLAEEILAPLLATRGVTLNISVEIHAETPEGFDDAKIRTVSENATTLKFNQSGFEDA
jgi:predicted AAA+ superfamily ATPase